MDLRIEIKKSLFSAGKNECHWCGKTLCFGDRDTTLDHIVPMSRGGRTDENNTVLACRSCNKKKGSGSGQEFLEFPYLIRKKLQMQKERRNREILH